MAHNLGKAISILLQHERKSADFYEDLSAFHAPSECHPVVSRGLARDFRTVRKHACATAGVKNLTQLRRAVKRVCPTWDRLNHYRLGITSI